MPVVVGKPAVTDLIPISGAARDAVLRIAATLESGSEHPLAKAILDHAAQLNVTLGGMTHFTAVPGKGVQAEIDGAAAALGSPQFITDLGIAVVREQTIALQQQGKTVIVVADGGRAIGIICIADQLRPTSPAAIARLQALSIEVVMLTGDNRATAQAIAAQAGIARFKAEVLPQHKAQRVAQFKQQECIVGMGGDGAEFGVGRQQFAALEALAAPRTVNSE